VKSGVWRLEPDLGCQSPAASRGGKFKPEITLVMDVPFLRERR
jgi:hypothetical protein